jgi:ATP-dependent RNA helicase DeaD
LRAVEESGYETPSAIQAASIPYLLEGRDLLGQAQTGTGKTAAFALPLLSRLDLSDRSVQILVLAPTRELAIQVAEAFQHYARHLDGFHVVPLYGGSGYSDQIRGLKRGAQVVVGTPGRLMDHMRKGTLKLDTLRALVLDEADEMLRMGFIDDVEWILEQTPAERQVALFSATMPREIQRVAERYLRDPQRVKMEERVLTAESVEQRYWLVDGLHKLDALTRILEAEPFDAMIVFVRTKAATEELAEKLAARGHACEPINGDIAQAQRERVVQRLKDGRVDILVATDVAARGLDVERITHVINYDIPSDPEAYVHRIGRTGRAGRTGSAVLFLSHRERRLLKAIERTIGRSIELMELPTVGDVNRLRIERFKNRIRETLTTRDLDFFARLIAEYEEAEETDPLMIAAALAAMVQGDEPLMLEERERRRSPPRDGKERNREGAGREAGRDKDKRSKGRRDEGGRREKGPDVPMLRYRLEVGAEHGVKPGQIVGAVANEAGLDGAYIGRITINQDHSTVDLPDGMPKEVFQALRRARVCGRPMAISLDAGDGPSNNADRPRKGKPKKR